MRRVAKDIRALHIKSETTTPCPSNNLKP